MNPFVTIDFETEYTKEISVKTLGVWPYLKRTRIYLVAIYDGDQEFVGDPAEFDWESLEGVDCVSHNAAFDRTAYQILVEKGVVPNVKFGDWNCTANLSSFLRAGRSLKYAAMNLLGKEVSKDIRKAMDGLSVYDGVPITIPDALVQLANAEGYEDPYDLVKQYALSDAKLSWEIWWRHSARWPDQEKRISLATIAQSTRGFAIDIPGLRRDYNHLNRYKFRLAKKLPWVEINTDENGVQTYDQKGVLSLNQAKKELVEQGFPRPKTLAEDRIEYQEYAKENPEADVLIRTQRAFRKANILQARVGVLLNRHNPETGRFPYSVLYYGAQTGRWTGGSNERAGGTGETGFNVHNFPKDSLRSVDLRKRVVAPAGKRLIVFDLAQIEPRVSAWLTGDHRTLDLMAGGMSVYEIHARQTMGWTGGSLKKEDKNLYALAKARVLGLGYGCGSVKFQVLAATQYGIHFSLQESKRIVDDFRRKEKLIVRCWDQLAKDMRRALYTKERKYEIELPSWRSLTYYDLMRTKGQLWARTETSGRIQAWYGGKLFENLVQATARDALCYLMLRIEEVFPEVDTLFSVHDELVLESPLTIGIDDILKFVRDEGIPWMPGLPLEAEGINTDHYVK